MPTVVTNILTNERWTYADGTNVVLSPYGIFQVSNNYGSTITVTALGSSTTQAANSVWTYAGHQIASLNPSVTENTVYKSGKKWQN